MFRFSVLMVILLLNAASAFSVGSALSFAQREITTSKIALNVPDSIKKADLVAKIAAKSGLNKTQVDAAITAFVDTITEAVSDGKKVSLAGFGTFESRERAARLGKNFHTGETISIAASKIPAFTASKVFKDLVKDSSKFI